MISPKLISPCRGRSDLVVIAAWVMLLGVMVVLILVCLLSSLVRRSGCSTMMCNCKQALGIAVGDILELGV